MQISWTLVEDLTVCRNLKFSSTKWAKALVNSNYILDKLH
jgi:hypothetical protein